MTYQGLTAATNTELAKIDDVDVRGQVARATLDAGLGPIAHVYFVKAVRHKLGHKAKRGDGIVPMPSPPAIHPAELEVVNRRITAAATALAPPAPAGPPPAIPPSHRPDTATRDRGRSWEES